MLPLHHLPKVLDLKFSWEGRIRTYTSRTNFIFEVTNFMTITLLVANYRVLLNYCLSL